VGVGPRIIVSSARGQQSDVSWSRSGTSPAAVTWRLIGANNRPLGRAPGPVPLATVDSLLQQLLADVGRLAFVSAAAQPGPLWTWRAELDRSVVAVSARGFQRQRDAAYSFRQFTLALESAVVVRDVDRPQAFRDRRRYPMSGSA
jgi:hypothetical protein